MKNVEWKMEHMTLPRGPWRDHAGTVLHGPAEWLGAEVWDPGGEIGYSVDGSHAELMALDGLYARLQKHGTLGGEEPAQSSTMS